MTRIKFLLALWLARLCRWAINIVAPGRGTNLPGQSPSRSIMASMAILKGSMPAR